MLTSWIIVANKNRIWESYILHCRFLYVRKYQDIQDTLKKGKFNIGSRCVQDDVEPLKPLILLGFLMMVQYGQDVFYLRIYKNRKWLKFNDSLKNNYNRYKRADVEPLKTEKCLKSSKIKGFKHFFIFQKSPRCGTDIELR